VLWFADNETVVEKDALVGKGAFAKLKAIPGRLVTLAKGRLKSYIRTPAPPLPEGLITIYNQMVSKCQDALGLHDQDIGARAKGEMTAYQVDTLQQNMKVGMGMQMALYDQWLLEIVERIAELDRKKLEAGDAVRIAGPAGAAKVDTFRDELRDVEMDISITIGASLPHDKRARKMEAGELYDRLKDPSALKYLLEAYEVPNVDEWLKNNQLYQQFLQFVAAQQAAAKQAGQGSVAAPPGSPPGPPQAGPQGSPLPVQ
jgi:hypothetical protein